MSPCGLHYASPRSVWATTSPCRSEEWLFDRAEGAFAPRPLPPASSDEVAEWCSGCADMPEWFPRGAGTKASAMNARNLDGTCLKRIFSKDPFWETETPQRLLQDPFTAAYGGQAQTLQLGKCLPCKNNKNNMLN